MMWTLQSVTKGFLLIVFFSQISAIYAEYLFKEDFIELPVDHFSFASNATFKMRYLYNDTYWNQSANAPIFFYTGNEGDITWFAQNTGFMWDIAPEFQALLVFAEHRYYGASLPFGNDSFQSPDKTGYLTSEQALADFAEFLVQFKSDRGITKSPVIAFGGSYGGMLTAWMRIKYPHIIQGGIAASAPILQFQGLAPCSTFATIVGRDFTEASQECADVIRASWKHLNSFAGSDSGRNWLSNNWRLCDPLKSKGDLQKLKDWLVSVYGNLAMVDYPYPANFLAPLPAWPIKRVCEKLTNPALPAKHLLKALFKGISVYFNFTGSVKCLDIGQQATQSLGDLGWDYQACTEMVMPMCNDGIKDIFEPVAWNETTYAEYCERKWKVSPRPNMAQTIYGGKDISASSNIVFSNGLLDPWNGGGVLKSISDTLVAVIIPEGAHHLDLRAANEGDPASVVKAREVEKQEIRRWIAEYHLEKSEPESNIDTNEITKDSLDYVLGNEIPK